MNDDQKQITISLNGGANQDSSPLNPAPEDNGVSPFIRGDYRYLLNMRNGSSVEDNIGAQENFISTFDDVGYYAWNGSEFVTASIPAGTNIAISKLEDRPKNNIYYCVWNSNGDHTVLKFSKSLRRTLEMIRWSGLNFDPANYVSMCKVNKWLILTDRLNPPRIMLVDGTSPDFTDGIWQLFSSLGADFSEYHISFAKWAPLDPPVPRRSNAGTSDFLEKGIFQFCYRYVFVGGFKTTFSPPSWFVTNEANGSDAIIELLIQGFIFDYETPANTSFDHDSVKFYDVVQFIEIAYRESTRDSWKLFKRHTVTSVATENIEFLFENNGPSAKIPTKDISQYFDSVPFKSGACESIDNRVNFADNEDELPAVTDFDVENVEVYSENPAANTWQGPVAAFSGLTVDQQLDLGLILSVRRFSFKERGIYKGGIVFQHFSGRENLVTTLDKWTWIIPSYTPTSPGSVENYNALGFSIPMSVIPPDWAVSYKIMRSNCLNMSYFLHGVVNDFIFLLNDESGFTDQLTTPDRVKSVKNDFFDNLSRDAKAAVIDRLSDRLTPEIRKNRVAASFADCSRIYMDVSNWSLTSAKSATQDWPGNSLYYNWEPGDRVRFWGSTTSNYDLTDLSRFDEEIVEYTGRGIIINKPSTLVTLKNRSGGSPNPSQSYLIEVYRPTKFNEDQEVLYWEMGEWYPITQPRTDLRDFSKRDFTWTDAASVTVSTVNGHTIYNKMPLINGDVWMVEKDVYFTFKGVFSGQLTGFIWPQMTQDPTRAGDYWEKNTGKPYVAYSYLPTVVDKETQIRFGGKFLQDSLFIGINNFRDEWQFIYPSEYGRIRALVNTANAQVESVGNILIAIGEVEAWSIYVNRTTLEDLSGSSQVAISDKVLGSFNTLLGSHGTLNPESVGLRNGRLVWWNAKQGEWVRYSRDGLTVISDKGMKNWFKDLSDLLINEYETEDVPKVLCTFDAYHKCWITFIDHASLPETFKGYASYKCVTFAERNADKFWKEWFDYTPELFASLGNEVYSIVGTKVYIHEEGETFGSIYGVKKDSYIEVIVNPEVLANKSWVSAAIEASDKWSFESIKGDWRSNNGTRQETRMRLDDLANKETTFWTFIKKDKNTPNASSEQSAVIDGENMRSKHLRIMMKLDPDVDYYSIFNYLIVTYIDSPLNPKKD